MRSDSTDSTQHASAMRCAAHKKPRAASTRHRTHETKQARIKQPAQLAPDMWLRASDSEPEAGLPPGRDFEELLVEHRRKVCAQPGRGRPEVSSVHTYRPNSTAHGTTLAQHALRGRHR
eukprot:1750178-Rhodomonas_salina.1